MTIETTETGAGAESSTMAAPIVKQRSRRRQVTPMQRELSEARPLLSAIALGLIFAITLTLAASLAPDSVGAKGGRISQPASSQPAPLAPATPGTGAS